MVVSLGKPEGSALQPSRLHAPANRKKTAVAAEPTRVICSFTIASSSLLDVHRRRWPSVAGRGAEEYALN